MNERDYVDCAVTEANILHIMLVHRHLIAAKACVVFFPNSARIFKLVNFHIFFRKQSSQYIILNAQSIQQSFGVSDPRNV